MKKVDARILKKSWRTCAERGERIGNTSGNGKSRRLGYLRVKSSSEEEKKGSEIYKPVSSRIKLVPHCVDVQRAGKEGMRANRTLMSAFNT